MKQRISIFIFLLSILLTYGCSNEKTTKNQTIKDQTITEQSTGEQSIKGETKKLTMDIVMELAEKKDELSWDDFKPYDGSDVIGSGLYIYMYPIDNKYSILVGGGSLEEKPMYIYLSRCIEDKENRIDIRYDNIEEYINGDK